MRYDEDVEAFNVLEQKPQSIAYALKNCGECFCTAQGGCDYCPNGHVIESQKEKKAAQDAVAGDAAAGVNIFAPKSRISKLWRLVRLCRDIHLLSDKSGDAHEPFTTMVFKR